MEIKRLLLPILMLSLISAEATAQGQPGPVAGGYTPVEDLTDPYVHEIANFAVSQHNKAASDDLVLVKVLSGRQQVVAGVNYDLTIAASHRSAGDDAAEEEYKAVVYDRQWDKYRRLTSFEKL